MDLLKMERALPKGWEIYGSGGGCYHATKEFEGKAVEVHSEAFGATMYHHHDEPEHIATADELVDGNLWENFIELCYFHHSWERIVFTDAMHEHFTADQADEILEATKVMSRGFAEIEQETSMSEFKKHMQDVTTEMLDKLDHGDVRAEDYIVKIELNDKYVEIPLNADLYESLLGIIDEEIEEGGE